MNRHRPARCVAAFSFRTLALAAPAAGILAPTPAQAQEATPASDTTLPAAPPGSGEPPSAPSAPSAPAVARPDEVSVVGTRVARTAGAAHVIGKKQLERFEYDDPQAALASVPGVYGRGEDGVGLRPNIGMRGVNPDRSKKLTLMEDGILFAPAPYSAPAAYYFPLITRMTAVRVIKGTGAVVYGPQSIGGALDLITRPIPRTTSGAVDTALGSYGYKKLHAHIGSSLDNIGFVVEGIHLGNDGFKYLPSGADTGFARNEWMFKGSYDFAPAARDTHTLTLKGTYADEVSNETYVGLSDADFRADSRQRYAASKLDRMQYHRTSLVLTHRIEVTPSLSITTSAYRHDQARTWRKVNRFQGADVFAVLRDAESPRNALFTDLLRGKSDSTAPDQTLFIGPNQRDYTSQGAQSQLRWDGNTGPLAHRLEYGLRIHYDRVERRHSEDGFRMTGGELVPTGGPTLVTAFNEAWTSALAMHLTDAVTWGPLSITPGVRVEAMRSVFKDKAAGVAQSQLTQVVLPGVGAFYSIVAPFGLLAGVYRGFSPPTPTIGPPSKPELSVNYEGGARFVKGRARVEVIGFYNDYSNMTDVCTLSSGCVDAALDRQFDAGAAQIYGLEAFAEHEPRIAGIRFPLLASYTLSRSRFLRDFKSADPIFGDVKVGDEVPYVPRHQLNASAGIEAGRAGFALAMNYVAPMREIAGSAPLSQSLATDEQLTFDASGNLRLFGTLSLYANIRNIADSRYIVGRRPYGARPNAPRWVQVGLKASF